MCAQIFNPRNSFWLDHITIESEISAVPIPVPDGHYIIQYLMMVIMASEWSAKRGRGELGNLEIIIIGSEMFHVS